MVLKRAASEDPFALCRWSQLFPNCPHAFYSNTSVSPSLSLAPSSSCPRTGVLHGILHSPGRSLSSWPVSCYHRVVGRIKLDNIYEALKTMPSTEETLNHLINKINEDGCGGKSVVKKQSILFLYLQITFWGNLPRAPASLVAMSSDRYLTPAPKDTRTKPCSWAPLTHLWRSCNSRHGS